MISTWPTLGTGKHFGADVLDVVAQLSLRQAVGGEGIDVAVDVAEAIVEERTDDAVRKIALDVGDHVADAHPGRRDVARLGRVAQVDEDRRLRRRR